MVCTLVVFISMMCMYIETFHVSVIAPNGTMVVYEILFGGMLTTILIQCIVTIIN